MIEEKKVAGIALGAVNAALQLMQMESGGGILLVMSAKNGLTLMALKVGNVPAEKFGDFLDQAFLNGTRLARFPDHVSSWQSRDLKLQAFGGAIRTQEAIISFAGIEETADESVALMIAYRLHLISIEEAAHISIIQSNTFFRELLDLMPVESFD